MLEEKEWKYERKFEERKKMGTQKLKEKVKGWK